MAGCKKYLATLIDGSYQQISATEKEKFNAEMDPACQEAFNRMKNTLDIASQQGAVDRVRTLGESYAKTETHLNTALHEWDTLVD